MASDAKSSDAVTIVLGDEYDDFLREKLMKVLDRLGASPLDPASRFLAGSQELEQLDVLIDGSPIRVVAETYIGLSITGREVIVQRIQDLLKEVSGTN